MIKFKSVDSFEIKGHGAVKVVENNCVRMNNDFRDLYPQVEIDGKVYKLKGGERQGMSQYKGNMIGLLVEDDNEQQEESAND